MERSQSLSPVLGMACLGCEREKYGGLCQELEILRTGPIL